MNKDHPNKRRPCESNYYRERAQLRGKYAQAEKKKAEQKMLETTSLKDLIK